MNRAARGVRTLADRATLIIIAALVMLGGWHTVSDMLEQRAQPASEPLMVHTPSGTMLSRAAVLDIERTGVRVGDSEAPVTVVAYIDYNCGWCARLDSQLVSLLRRYPDHLSVVYKDFVTESDPVAMDVHVAARCAADQAVFLRYHRALFGLMGMAHLRNGWQLVAQTVDIPDRDRFDHCVLGDRYRAEVEADSREARRLGFTATPSGIIGGHVFEGTPSQAALDSLVVSEIIRAARPNER